MATKEELGREILAELENIPDKEWEVSWFVSSFIVPRSLIRTNNNKEQQTSKLNGG